jgi:hypothetical protein
MVIHVRDRIRDAGAGKLMAFSTRGTAMTPRRFPPPWSVTETQGAFRVDASHSASSIFAMTTT